MAFVRIVRIDFYFSCAYCLKAADLQNKLKFISYKYFKISLQLYIIVVRNKKPRFFALKTDNSLFCRRDIPTIHNGYCVSNAVDYGKINDVLPTTLSIELRGQ